MKTNKFAGKDPCRWQAGEVSKTQGEGAQAWHQYRYASGTSPAQAPFSPWDEAAADAVEAAINLPHVADILVPDANLNASFTREELCSNLRRTATRRNMYPPSSRPTAETVTAEANAGSFSVVGDNILRICGLYNGVPVSP